MNEYMKTPFAKKIEKKLSIHGHTRTDPYYWLRERENPEVIKYLEDENAYTGSNIDHETEERLFDEIIARIKQEDTSVPYLDNGYYYYTRYEEGLEYPVYCRRKDDMDNDEEILLNVNEMAEGHSYFHVGGWSVSPDNKKLAFSVDSLGRRKYTLHVKVLDSGKILKDEIPLTSGSASWANDSKTLFYTLKDETTLRSCKIFRHLLGYSPEEDVMVWHEKDETFSTFVYRTKSDRFIIIGSSSTLSEEYQFLDADYPGGDFHVIQPREKDLEYSVEHYRDKFYIRTNLNAKNFRLMEAPVSSPSRENWKELIPHREDVFLKDLEIFDNYLVISERVEGITRLRILDRISGEEHYVDFDEQVYVAGISINPSFETRLLRFSYTSLTTPGSTFDYNMETRERKLLKEQEVVGDFNKDNYRTSRIYAPADDGTLIPISLVYREGFQQDGSQPMLLYAYGSYGHTIEPSFGSAKLSLIDRGFVFAIAHVRGGQINGRKWYEDGKLLNKKNTFTDFNDCAEFLLKEKYTSTDRLFAQGGSAGGLLIGAIVNMQPELYKGVIAAVPFVDVVTTMLDEDIPLTTSEYDEWGDPNQKEFYDYMLSYSPYDNVREMAYPAMLVTSGLHDSQVQYWEPAKWVARLREMKKDNNLLLLHTNMDSGHGGASGRFEYYREVAREYTFLLQLAGRI
jgi:oligopeptidase B